MPHYDLAIIGSGSGNSLITPFWDGKRVALIDGGTFGGTCINVGCIPTKMFVYPAALAAVPAEAARLGVELTLDNVHWNAIRDRIFGRIDAISEGGRRYRADELDNVDLYQEYVRFTGPASLRTDSGTGITADQVVVAAGSRAVVPDIPGMDLPQVHTSDTVMRIDGPPRHVVVVGGGFIAAEFAAIFHGFGSEVVQVNRSQRLLRGNDEEISRRFAEAAGRRWKLELDFSLHSVEDNGDGRVTAVFGDGGGKQLRLETDIVLMATGRVPNTDRLDVGAAGFDVNADGTLAVDGQLRVLSQGKPLEGVYALGDIANRYQLKHVANREARVVAHNLEHPDRLRGIDYKGVPAAVFSNPQVAAVGLTEEQARRDAADDSEIVVAVQEYGSTAYGWAMEDSEGIVKLIAEKSTGRLLGAHIMGHEASTLIQPLVQAIALDTPVSSLARGPYWIHPALTEVVENALLALDVDVPDNAAL
ncbi:mycothione reductase [Pseudarthrobacter sp. H3Y2-7]|jgi:mycothione reductase|uniref:mycothione reductase n=1 Tax=Pseudarthrobacter TaxID=1742993 RepID=UPI0023AFF946|nr:MULTISPECIES: mycothione reductase [unclassified Pseudarthrobacter]MDE8668345.1 mycothione reductase [Pseudarthrobacter sp. H3Y2-7]